MFNKRFSPPAGRRLRVEPLEYRDVPSAVDGIIDPPSTDPSVVVQVGTDTTTTLPPGAVNIVIDPIMTATTTNATPQGPPVDLAAFASIDRIKPSVGDTVTMKVTIANNGPVQATGVAVTTTLPAGMTFVSADVAATKFDPATGIWSLGTIASKAKTVLTIKAKVTDAAPQSIATTITHADQVDDKVENNAASVTVSPVLAALNLTKTMSTPAAAVGSTVVVNVAVGNKGPGMARHVVVNDTMGTGLKFARVIAASHGSYNPSTGVWSIGALPAGTIAVLRYAATVNAFARIESPATLTATGFDAARSKIDATAVVSGVKGSGVGTWSYFAGANFGHGVTPVPVAAKPATTPKPPVSIVNGLTTTQAVTLALYLKSQGIKIPGFTL